MKGRRRERRQWKERVTTQPLLYPVLKLDVGRGGLHQHDADVMEGRLDMKAAVDEVVQQR
jgi:hypothetical protein